MEEQRNVLEKMRSDIAILDRQIAAKYDILKEVFCDLKHMESSKRRSTIREVFAVEPIGNIAKTDNSSCKLMWSMGFEDFVCSSITIENKHEKWHMYSTCHLTGAVGKWKFRILDSAGCEVDALGPSSTGTLLVGLPRGCFISNDSLNLLIDFSWISNPPLASDVPLCLVDMLVVESNIPPTETSGIKVEEPPSWKIMSSFLNCSAREASQLKQCSSVCLYSATFNSIEAFEFRNQFPSFDCSDFGEWQVFIGCGLYDGLMVIADDDHPGQLSTAFSRSDHLLKNFVTALNRRKPT